MSTDRLLPLPARSRPDFTCTYDSQQKLIRPLHALPHCLRPPNALCSRNVATELDSTGVDWTRLCLIPASAPCLCQA